MVCREIGRNKVDSIGPKRRQRQIVEVYINLKTNHTIM